MKKIITILVLGIFILGVVGAFAFSNGFRHKRDFNKKINFISNKKICEKATLRGMNLRRCSGIKNIKTHGLIKKNKGVYLVSNG